MKCTRCGYQSPAQFGRCPYCGAVQTVGQPVASASPYTVKASKRSGGETAAIVTAITVSIISVVAAFFIFIAFMSYMGSKIMSGVDFSSDSFGDFDSDEFEDKFDSFFDFSDNNEIGSVKSPVGMNTPLKFKEKLYSFSEGEVETEYEVAMTETYRGEAALKLLEGAALPIYNDQIYEIYLVRFNVTITDQKKDAIVTMPIVDAVAYPSDSARLFYDEFETSDGLDYANKYALIQKGDTLETWVAFIIDKDEQSPVIMWNEFENKAFCNKNQAVSSADSLEAGSALEKKDVVSSEEADEEISSESDTSSD